MALTESQPRRVVGAILIVGALLHLLHILLGATDAVHDSGFSGRAVILSITGVLLFLAAVVLLITKLIFPAVFFFFFNIVATLRILMTAVGASDREYDMGLVVMWLITDAILCVACGALCYLERDYLQGACRNGCGAKKDDVPQPSVGIEAA